LGGCSPPEWGKIIFFSGNRAIFSGSGQKMKNNILKIINEKYEKYSKKSSLAIFHNRRSQAFLSRPV